MHALRQHLAGHAEAGRDAHARRLGQGQRTRTCLSHHGPGNRMIREALDRCGQPQHIVLSGAGHRHDRPHCHLAVRQRAGLVERHHAHPGQPLECSPALDQHAVAGRRRQRRHQRHRRRDHQRTRTADHQRHQPAIQPGLGLAAIHAGPDPGHQRQPHRHGHDGRRIPLGEAIDELLHRRPPGLCILDEVHHARQQRLGVGAGHPHRNRPVPVDGAGKHLVTRMPVDGRRFARDGCLVHVGVTADHMAIHRDALPGENPHARTHRHLGGRHRRAVGGVIESHHIRRHVQQGPDGLAGPAHRPRLHPLRHAEQHHHRRALGILANRQRPENGQHHQAVDVEATAPGSRQRPPGRLHRPRHAQCDQQPVHAASLLRFGRTLHLPRGISAPVGARGIRPPAPVVRQRRPPPPAGPARCPDRRVAPRVVMTATAARATASDVLPLDSPFRYDDGSMPLSGIRPVGRQASQVSEQHRD